jgi:16S rRNA (guanine527-N7)-methyltransferase
MSDDVAKNRVAELTYVSRETFSKLEVYASALEKWNPSINLVSKTTLVEKWNRHFLDSLQLHEIAPANVNSWADIGSGAGFPGLALAILYADINPETKFTCIESDARKCAFLRNTARLVGIDMRVITERVESVDNFQADVVSARALATIDQLLSYSGNILPANGTCLFLKGQACDKELAEAKQNFRFDATKQPSHTAPDAWMVKLTGISAR